jgi:branched-chain amino acid transport system substrate-binding protein
MKKIALIGLAAASIIALAACGSAPGTSKGGSEKGNTIGKTFKIAVKYGIVRSLCCAW